eukprot:754853-Hanusia_phi.AAC.4
MLRAPRGGGAGPARCRRAARPGGSGPDDPDDIIPDDIIPGPGGAARRAAQNEQASGPVTELTRAIRGGPRDSAAAPPVTPAWQLSLPPGTSDSIPAFNSVRPGYPAGALPVPGQPSTARREPGRPGSVHQALYSYALHRLSKPGDGDRPGGSR